MGELKPCPRCGADYPRFIMRYYDRLLFKRYFVECWKCRFAVRPRISVAMAAKAWNKKERYYEMSEM